MHWLGHLILNNAGGKKREQERVRGRDTEFSTRREGGSDVFYFGSINQWKRILSKGDPVKKSVGGRRRKEGGYPESNLDKKEGEIHKKKKKKTNLFSTKR